MEIGDLNSNRMAKYGYHRHASPNKASHVR